MQFSRGQVIVSKSHYHKGRGRRRCAVLKIAGILGLAAVAVGLGMTQFYGEIKVEIAIQSDLSDRIESAATDYLRERPLERVVALLDEAHLLEYLSEKVPEMDSGAEVERTGWWVPDMVVQAAPREPLLVWRINGEKHFVDKAGVVFASNYYQLDPSIEIVDYNNMEVGEKMPKTFLQFLGQFTADAGEVGMRVEKLVIPAGKSREIDVSVVYRDKVVVFKLSVDRSAMEQIEDINRVMAHFDENGVKLEALEYVDIRVKRRAFYK
ncbi:MAG: hypothetical protein LBQ02_03165 [Candidatus Nomurabacteria bacterium]|jgi:hypothetical protein|nr:hypothetical protein [Candidatus Nomurabacteria bacterium]